MKLLPILLTGTLILMGTGCDGAASPSASDDHRATSSDSGSGSEVIGDGTAIVATISGDQTAAISAKARFRCGSKPGESYIQIYSTPRNPMRLEFMFPAELSTGTHDLPTLNMPQIDHTPTYPITLIVKDSEVVLGRRYFTDSLEGTLILDALGSATGSQIAGSFEVTLGSKASVINEQEKAQTVRIEGHFDYTTTKDDRCK